jgi:hypothetical protein
MFALPFEEFVATSCSFMHNSARANMSMSTPANNPFRQLAFFTLAGVAITELKGELIVGAQKDPLPDFRGAVDGHLCAHFVNWPTDPKAIEGFTRKFGSLRAPLKSGQTFAFRLSDWKLDQDRIRAAWDQSLYLFQKFGLRNHGSLALRTVPAEDGEEFVSKHGALEYKANSLFRFLWLEFASTSLERLRKCKLKDCPTPYFIASHLGQRYCTEVCAHQAQCEWKKNWWKDRGTNWRQKRFQKKHTDRKAKKRRRAK